MKKLIIVSATRQEISPLLTYLEREFERAGDCYTKNQISIDICITGVGMVATAFALGKYSTAHYDLALNLGVAGAFHTYENGSVVSVVKDCFAELGAQDGALFLPIDEMALGTQEQTPHVLFNLPASLALPQVKGITVNTVHGEEQSIAAVEKRLNPAIESMEGAAFFYACNQNNWTCLQIRAISNKVERRDKSKWQMREAIDALSNYVLKLLDAISYYLLG